MILDIESPDDDDVSGGFSLRTLTRPAAAIARRAQGLSPSHQLAQLLTARRGMRTQNARHRVSGSSMMGDYSTTDAAKDIASATPYGRLALFAVSKKRQIGNLLSVAKKAVHKSPKLANAARVLAKAKGGDEEAKAHIKAVGDLAKRGHDGAKAAVARLKLLDQHTGSYHPIAALNTTYRQGIS